MKVPGANDKKPTSENVSESHEENKKPHRSREQVAEKNKALKTKRMVKVGPNTYKKRRVFLSTKFTSKKPKVVTHVGRKYPRLSHPKPLK